MARIVGYIPPKKEKAPPKGTKGSKKTAQSENTAAPAPAGGAEPTQEA